MIRVKASYDFEEALFFLPIYIIIMRQPLAFLGSKCYRATCIGKSALIFTAHVLVVIDRLPNFLISTKIALGKDLTKQIVRCDTYSV